MTPGGWREAQELSVGDRVLQAVPHHLSDFQWEVVLGGLMGDGALSPTRSGHGARFRWGHGAKQAAYGDWKASLFANVGVSRSTNAKGAVFYDVQPLPELAELREAVYVGGKKVLSHDYLKRLTPLSLAIWYMDDGGFTLRAKGLQERTKDGSGRSEICVEAMAADTRERLVGVPRRHLGHPAEARRNERGKAVLVFPKDETAKLHALIAPFVHPVDGSTSCCPSTGALRRRAGVRSRCGDELAAAADHRDQRQASDSRSRCTASTSRSRAAHNYFVDGVMVHNSPETTPGGRALKFYSSVRLDIRRIESIKDGVEVVGNRTRVKVVKNKVAPPFRQAEFDIMYGKGISREGSLLDIGVDLGIVKKSGAWYTYEGEQLGQGRENAKSVPHRQPRDHGRDLRAHPQPGGHRRRRTATCRRRPGSRRSSRPTARPDDDEPITLD